MLHTLQISLWLIYSVFVKQWAHTNFRPQQTSSQISVYYWENAGTGTYLKLNAHTQQTVAGNHVPTLSALTDLVFRKNYTAPMLRLAVSLSGWFLHHMHWLRKSLTVIVRDMIKQEMLKKPIQKIYSGQRRSIEKQRQLFRLQITDLY